MRQEARPAQQTKQVGPVGPLSRLRSTPRVGLARILYAIRSRLRGPTEAGCTWPTRCWRGLPSCLAGRDGFRISRLRIATCWMRWLQEVSWPPSDDSCLPRSLRACPCSHRHAPAAELQGVLVCAAPVEEPAATPWAAPALGSAAPASVQEALPIDSSRLTGGQGAEGSQEASVAAIAEEVSDSRIAAVRLGEHIPLEAHAADQAAQSSVEEQPGQLSSEQQAPSSRAHMLNASEHVLRVHSPGALPPGLAGCPAVYLARSDNDSSRALTTDEQLTAHVSATLLPAGPSLTSLHQLLQLVVAPWLAAHQPESSLSAGDSTAHLQLQACNSTPTAGLEEPGSSAASCSPTASAAAKQGAVLPASAELLAATHKLAGHVAAAAKHLRSEVAVRLPTRIDLTDVAAAAANEEAVLTCEHCVEEWVLLATATLQREASAKPRGTGPLAELEFWQARAEAYGRLLEQLSMPAVQSVAEVVQRGSSDAALAGSFKAQLAELARLAMDARDNSRFLATLERHFRALVDGSLAAVADAVQPMLNTLRTVGDDRTLLCPPACGPG